MPGRASGVKMVVMAEMGAPISQDGWQSFRTVGAFACVIFILLLKIQNMANKDMKFGCHPVGDPTCLCRQEVGKPSWNAAQPCCVNDDLRADGLWKGWEFRVGT